MAGTGGKQTKGPVTTPKGTKGRKKMLVGAIRANGTWSGRRRMVVA